MNTFKKEDFEGNGIQFSIGGTKIRILLARDGKYYCTANFNNLTCCSKCKHYKAAIKSAVGKLALSLIEHGYVTGISDKDGDEWFNKAFMGEYDS